MRVDQSARKQHSRAKRRATERPPGAREAADTRAGELWGAQAKVVTHRSPVPSPGTPPQAGEAGGLPRKPRYVISNNIDITVVGFWAACSQEARVRAVRRDAHRGASGLSAPRSDRALGKSPALSCFCLHFAAPQPFRIKLFRSESMARRFPCTTGVSGKGRAKGGRKAPDPGQRLPKFVLSPYVDEAGSPFYCRGKEEDQVLKPRSIAGNATASPSARRAAWPRWV